MVKIAQLRQQDLKKKISYRRPKCELNGNLYFKNQKVYSDITAKFVAKKQHN